MHWIVAYDVRSPARLRRVARVAEDFGFRVQRSVFECELDDRAFESMWRRFAREMDETRDLLLAVPLCADCLDGLIERGRTLACDTPGQDFFRL